MSTYRKYLERMMSRERYAMAESVLRNQTLNLDPTLRATCLQALEQQKTWSLSSRTASHTIAAMDDEKAPLRPLWDLLNLLDERYGDTRCRE